MLDNNIELRPCPFCGAKAQFFEQYSCQEQTELKIRFGITCPKCGQGLKDTGTISMRMSGDGTLRVADERKELAEIWNRRA